MNATTFRARVAAIREGDIVTSISGGRIPLDIAVELEDKHGRDVFTATVRVPLDQQPRIGDLFTITLQPVLRDPMTG